METKTERYYFLSFLRVVALLSVLFAHFTSNIVFPSNLKSISNIISYFSVFGIFAFFFISGFLYQRYPGDSKVFWKKKIFTIIIPFFAASLFLFIVSLIKYRTVNMELLAGLLGYGNYLWFVPVLLLVFLVYKISSKPIFDYILIGLAIVSLTITTINLGNITSILVNSKMIYFLITQYFGFFSLGRIIKRSNIYNILTKKLALIILVICLAILVIIVFCDFVEVFYWNFAGHMIAVLFLIIFVTLSKLFVGRFFDTYCSPYIYTIYLFHMLPYQFVLLRIPFYLSIPWAVLFEATSIGLLFLLGLLAIKAPFLKTATLCLGFRSRTKEQKDNNVPDQANKEATYSPFLTLNKTGRIETVDLLKLFAATLVILSHCMMKYISNGTSNPLFNFIWITQMPLFMFASGFLNIKSERVSTIKQLLYRFLRNALCLLVPCLTFLLIGCFLDSKSPISSIISFYNNPETNLWFLWVLFVIHLVFDLGLFLSNYIKKKISFLIPVLSSLFISIIIFVLMVCLSKKFSFNTLSLKLIAYYIPFYCFGYLFHIFIKSKVPFKKSTSIISFAVFGVALIIVLFECFFFKSIHSFDDSNLGFVFVRLIGSASSIYLCVFIADLLTKFKWVLKVSKFGSFSLQAYFIHIILLRFLSFSSEFVVAQWAIAFGAASLLIAMIALILGTIYFIPFLHLAIFGKSFSFYKFEKKIPKIFL